jgi:hypothetical protein
MTHSSYAFRSPEKVALQEIGPRFTLKLRWLKKNIPAVQNFGEQPQPLAFDSDPTETEPKETASEQIPKKVVPPKQDEYIWTWKVCLSSLLTTAFHSSRLSAGIGDNKTHFLLVTFRLLVITKQIFDTCSFSVLTFIVV